MVKKHKQSRRVFTYAFRARKRQAISRDNMCRNRPIFRIQFFICNNINKGVGLVFWIISFTSNRYWIAFNAGLLQFLLSEMLYSWSFALALVGFQFLYNIRTVGICNLNYRHHALQFHRTMWRFLSSFAYVVTLLRLFPVDA